MRMMDNKMEKQIDAFFDSYLEKKRLVRLFNTLVSVSFDDNDDIYLVVNNCLGAGKRGEALRFFVVEKDYSFKVKFKCKEEFVPFSIKELMHYKEIAENNKRLFDEYKVCDDQEDDLYKLMISREYAIEEKTSFFGNLQNTRSLKYNFSFYHFHNYYPKRYGYDIDSDRVRLLKWHDVNAMNYYYDLLKESLPEGCKVCTVPPSRKNKANGLMAVLNALGKKGYIDYCPCLERSEDIDKKAYGGKRNSFIEERTINYVFGYNMLNENVILIDDICTSGASLAACRNILLNHNVANVECLVLGVTKEKNNAY